jgi:hypothetical protein
MAFGFRVTGGYVRHSGFTFSRFGPNGQFQKLDLRSRWSRQPDWPKLGL